MDLQRSRLAAVVQRWYLLEPPLFSAWTTHDLVSQPRIRTLRVGSGRIEYNPVYLQGLNDSLLEAMMSAEATRILLKHPYLRRKPQPELAYLASNLTLKEVLKTDLPWPTARQLLQTPRYDGQYFEFYYRLLCQQDWPVLVSLELALENSQGWDSDAFLVERINEQLRQAQASSRWGSVAGRWREQILATLQPELDYRAVLAHFRSSLLSSACLLTRMKPSRRYGFEQLGRRYQFTTDLLLAVDVSGSISSKDLATGFSIINQFFRYGIRSLDVLCFDTKIKTPPTTWRRARSQIEVIGRGGTNFTPVLKYIDENNRYDGLIIFIDGRRQSPTGRETEKRECSGSSTAATTTSARRPA
ncbi:MAG: hypothetical protein KF760_28450 [Candidatus Eremiobacteraeota bacterium]|nr:hypothetical protein [Candidatus Eremiobacteraeota bacterium]MCW5865827.1 hypothetical protein [Candidatus Eremiobacteraeota bacterium]